MPRIRSVKPEFFTSPDMASHSLMTRLTFVGLWTFADDYGVAPADERLIKAAVWPLDDDVTREDVARALDELEKRAQITRYTVDGRRYLHIVEWGKHQRVDRPSKTRYPGPDQAEPDPSPQAGASLASGHRGLAPSRARAGTRNEERGTGSVDTTSPNGEVGRSHDQHSAGRSQPPDTPAGRAVAAFVDTARAEGYEPIGTLRQQAGGLASKALKIGIDEPMITEALRECARRREFSAWGHILADLQTGASPGRRNAPRAAPENIHRAGLRAAAQAGAFDDDPPSTSGLRGLSS